MTPDDVIDFWLKAGEERWFVKDTAFDGALSVRFKEALAKARDGAFDHWAETPRGMLALILMLDQFSRNIHRGSPLAFAADKKALALARRAVSHGDHLTVPAPLAMWLIMPFEHAEDLDAQRRCVALFAARQPDMVHWAKLHLDIIERFGRFPHRNAILGRKSTPEELAFLAAGGFSG
ncbi:DUF924 domain-containing protein [Nordella sp. HKS 07]|uniref:DUF924 family protein n=1 Tax=Nordella sp. HKS 07 TaxID=2712222 RepID=UPI0013E1F63C|nr:DUF924 family protein [Nordella sp. HKS 07]QIG48229.1 DUF924 domain-containing protein [Nordella sp. HKS 07]